MSNSKMSSAEVSAILDRKEISDKDARRALREVITLQGELAFYVDREKFFARELDVSDGGRYRNDWPGALERLLNERNSLRNANRFNWTVLFDKDDLVKGVEPTFPDALRAARMAAENRDHARVSVEQHGVIMLQLHKREGVWLSPI